MAADVLEKILLRKREEIALLNRRYCRSTLEELARAADPVRGFVASINDKVASGRAGVIAEIKRASPSKGLIRADFDPAWIAREYAAAGAACLSVLTDESFFQGHNAFLVQARLACGLPAIRKDFLIDEAQVVEARAIGADCVLLIAAALSTEQLKTLYACARAWQLDVLVEVHDAEELDQVLSADLGDGWLLGINNRNLRTFETRLETTLDLLARIPEGLEVVTESGIGTADDIARMRSAGVHRFLIGESLMRQDSPGAALRTLLQ
ncbi:indole-3-glycerol phosphate synthase TrpC [Sinimarinibacterium sp. CAU 1509]|uniref:indole-3-glycerol phosphate synthase TrpC n=1 Tax=Sinimarinibacterium sp. CAU 1509 TaxID=2562283 RepID=UPI0010AD38C1|nr:indole-3-glycerol phosphate synthase TrpC [Sinimarinibacterium sp. CAU 1509]TJY65091.1 indole-3-glycerol phosphate synthase TrpC [Sinimarinibacterium sp. CAU 1509]